jgi:GTP-binding protein
VVGKLSLTPNLTFIQGRTKALNFFAIGPPPDGKLVLVDAPGYGRVSRQEWGQLFDHYITTREQYVFNVRLKLVTISNKPFRRLRRVYILMNFNHGMKESDMLMLEHLNELILSGKVSWSLQPIFTHVDSMKSDSFKKISELRQELLRTAPAALSPLFTAAKKPIFGVDEVRSSISEACSFSIS